MPPEPTAAAAQFTPEPQGGPSPSTSDHPPNAVREAESGSAVREDGSGSAVREGRDARGAVGAVVREGRDAPGAVGAVVREGRRGASDERAVPAADEQGLLAARERRGTRAESTPSAHARHDTSDGERLSTSAREERRDTSDKQALSSADERALPDAHEERSLSNHQPLPSADASRNPADEQRSTSVRDQRTSAREEQQPAAAEDRGSSDEQALPATPEGRGGPRAESAPSAHERLLTSAHEERRDTSDGQALPSGDERALPDAHEGRSPSDEQALPATPEGRGPRAESAPSAHERGDTSDSERLLASARKSRSPVDGRPSPATREAHGTLTEPAASARPDREPCAETAPSPSRDRVPRAEPLLVSPRRRAPSASASEPRNPPLLSVRDLRIRFPRAGVEVVRGVSFDVRGGEVLALVGESGAGKSLTARALLGMVPGGAEVHGEVRLAGAPVTPADWGRRIALVPQDALSALSPVHRVGDQLAAAVRSVTGVSRQRARAEAAAALDRVGVPAARTRAYPHELSGGMRQRAVIAMAVVNSPEVVVADEPTTALDPERQEQVLALLAEQREATGAALVLVTHDLPVVRRHADRAAVLYAGRLAEYGPVDLVLGRPRAPYTAGLLAAVPDPGAPHRSRLPALPGRPATAEEALPGCAFAPRCAHAVDRCRAEVPPLRVLPDGRSVACHLELA
ncbi:oligopeptide/dipeptide ABC transporter ATP-binding protein [Streptomyces sp. Da 82-17]|uniref:oligopeptide/dipeptide ABC transporter ATP-binding protein n=1 Tax=Streptomyces sp. Da 82-17 TaxID=3377116 RepID=UPI0038D3B412